MFKVKGGMKFIEGHPLQFCLIAHNRSLDDIMAFGDEYRSYGKVPMVKLPSPTLGGVLGPAWDNHEAADEGKLLLAIPTHIDGFITDYASVQEPVVPSEWEAGCSVLNDKKRWLLWEKSRADVYFNGTKAEFIELFKIDPEGTLNEEPTGGNENEDPNNPPVVIPGIPSHIRVDVHIYDHGNVAE